MVDSVGFKAWLKSNTAYSDPVVRDMVSRMKRADAILEWDNTETYLFFLEKEEAFSKLSVSVKSQIRKAVKSYSSFSAT